MASTARFHASRRFWRYSAAIALPMAVTTFFALAPTAGATTKAPKPLLGAVSAGVLNALAVHQGTVVPRSGAASPAAPGVTVLPNVRVSNNGSQPNNEVPIAANPANALQLESGANDYNCSSVQGFFNSNDGGFTWPNQHCMPTLSGKVGFGDPNVAYGVDGTAYILGIDATSSLTNGVIAFQKSTDNGVTWSTVAAGPDHFYSNGLTDKEWTEIDHSATSPFAGCIYTIITQFNTSFTKETITVDHSCDGGTTWSGPIAVSAEATSPNVNQFSDLAVDKNGKVYATWMNCTTSGGICANTTATFYLSTSTDGGTTWSVPSVITTAKLATGSCGAFYGCIPGTSERLSNIPVIDVDASLNLYVAYYDSTPGFVQLKTIKSTTGGVSWNAPVTVCPACTGDQFFHWLSLNQTNGRVGVTYGNNTSGTSYGWNVAVSLNGGANYKGNKAITTATSNFNSDGFGGGFIGDYSGNIWVGNTLHAVWPDTRSGNSQDEWGGVSM